MPMVLANCLANSVLPTPVGTGEEKTADRFFRMAQSGTGQFDRARQHVDGGVLTEDDELKIAV